MMRSTGTTLVALILFIGTSLAIAEDFRVIRQVAGPIKTNCYLIYDVKSGEAAIIDPGWQIDSLEACIKEHDLHLKYIFITHGHIDHFYELPEIRKHFPGAKWCINKDDYEGIFTYPEWALQNYGQEWVDNARSDPETRLYIDFDNQLIGVPDIFVGNSMTFTLGSLEIKAMLAPGHSPGGICYYTGNILFSGDVLFYRTVGTTNSQHGSREDQINSVRRLYSDFPDSTRVYPGHGRYTDIGSEKKANSRITVDGGEWIKK
jgi:glyoxylase-like metal-dependent hydrolase (beta-lactamase superfamily II)